MTRSPAPQQPPACLTIAGSDSGGGAGIQADLKAMEAAGAFGTSAITAVTAQHTQGVERSYVLPLEEIEAQIDAVLGDIDIGAIKTGMLGTTDVIELVRERVQEIPTPLVVDPVMVATSGDRLLDDSAESAYPKLIGEADIVTPNIDEAEVLTGGSIETTEDAIAAGESLLETGVGAALVKGGHLDVADVHDILVTRETIHEYRHPRVASRATHGSGCTLASTIAARLAHDDDIMDAVANSLASMERAVRYPIDIGEGPGSVHHMATVRNDAEKVRTFEAVHELVDALVRADVTPLVSEGGINVVGVTPYGEAIEDTAGVDGRITRTSMGIRTNAGITVGTRTQLARLLLDIRESHPSIRFGAACPLDTHVESALHSLDLAVTEISGNASDRGFDGTDWTDAEEAPAAILDRQEPSVTFLASEAAILQERLLAVAEHVETAP